MLLSETVLRKGEVNMSLYVRKKDFSKSLERVQSKEIGLYYRMMDGRGFYWIWDGEHNGLFPNGGM